ncbi:MAG: TonB-dependent receptor [bacterium]|nr:TonB-dependent receptor [bacterium]
MKSLLVFIGVALAFACSAAAQNLLNLSGLVLDDRTGLPLPGADVVIDGSPFGVAADAEGRFYFYNLPMGGCDLKITHIGYKTITRRVVLLAADTPLSLEFRLSPIVLEMDDETTVETKALPSAGYLSGGTVLGRNVLTRTGTSDLGKILEENGLATITSDGSPGGKRSVTLRGSNSDQVLVLVDGRPINESGDGTADLSQVSLSEIQQIEVYPQAPSSLSAQAIGGVINIITLYPGRNRMTVKTGYSDYGDKTGSILLGRNVSNWRFLSMYEHQEGTGKYPYRVVPDDGLELFTRSIGEILIRSNAEYQRDYLTLKLNPPGVLELSYRRNMSSRQNPDYLPLPEIVHESTTTTDHQEFNVSLKGAENWYRPRVTLHGESYRLNSITDYGSQYPLLYKNSSLRGEVYSGSLDWSRGGESRTNLNFGTGARLERLWSPDLLGGYAERLHEFGYFQAQGNPLQELNLPVNTGLFGGVRTDLYSGGQVFIYPRFGVEVKTGKIFWAALRGESAGAFRLPSFNSLFWQEDLQAQGNPNLKPERAENREIAASLGYKSAEFGVSYFDRKIWDLIYWRLDFDNRWKPLNLSKARIFGIEYIWKYQLGKGDWAHNIFLTHRWMHAINQSNEPNTDGRLLPYRPVNNTVFTLEQNLRYLHLTATARWVSRRFTNEANTKSLSPYQVWDFGLWQDFSLNRKQVILTCRFDVTNLFNQSYRIVDAAPTPLREWRISLSLQQN